jgi:bifunctional non-homologous end joining protein LigD
VLVSWAIPNGVPTDLARNHLAVQTEDHPLAYGAFEGTIPAGQYGAGEVTIWDKGTYDLEKWRDETTRLPIEQTGAKMRAMMPWIAKNKLVDQAKN